MCKRRVVVVVGTEDSRVVVLEVAGPIQVGAVALADPSAVALEVEAVQSPAEDNRVVAQVEGRMAAVGRGCGGVVVDGSCAAAVQTGCGREVVLLHRSRPLLLGRSLVPACFGLAFAFAQERTREVLANHLVVRMQKCETASGCQRVDRRLAQVHPRTRRDRPIHR